MELFLEATLDSLTQTAISNFTQKHLDKRETEGDSRIDVAKSTWDSKHKYYEAIFYAKSSLNNAINSSLCANLSAFLTPSILIFNATNKSLKSIF